MKEAGVVTLVPFHNETLTAGTDFKLIDEVKGQRIEHLKPGTFEVEALKAELAQCFLRVGRLTENDYNARVCVKTEQYNPAHPDVDLKIYSEREVAGVYGSRCPRPHSRYTWQSQSDVRSCPGGREAVRMTELDFHKWEDG